MRRRPISTSIPASRTLCTTHAVTLPLARLLSRAMLSFSTLTSTWAATTRALPLLRQQANAQPLLLKALTQSLSASDALWISPLEILRPRAGFFIDELPQIYEKIRTRHALEPMLKKLATTHQALHLFYRSGSRTFFIKGMQ
jgi:hypothetical protein